MQLLGFNMGISGAHSNKALISIHEGVRATVRGCAAHFCDSVDRLSTECIHQAGGDPQRDQHADR